VPIATVLLLLFYLKILISLTGCSNTSQLRWYAVGVCLASWVGSGLLGAAFVDPLNDQLPSRGPLLRSALAFTLCRPAPVLCVIPRDRSYLSGGPGPLGPVDRRDPESQTSLWKLTRAEEDTQTPARKWWGGEKC
jgi:hypothetical protein